MLGSDGVSRVWGVGVVWGFYGGCIDSRRFNSRSQFTPPTSPYQGQALLPDPKVTEDPPLGRPSTQEDMILDRALSWKGVKRAICLLNQKPISKCHRDHRFHHRHNSRTNTWIMTPMNLDDLRLTGNINRFLRL